MNMLEEYINFEKNNITKFAKEILVDYYDEDLFSKLLDTYIKNRYYNYFENKEVKIEENIFEHLRKTISKLIDDKTPEEIKNKLGEMYVLFNYILCFDEVNILNDNTLVRLLCDYRKELFGITDTIFQENIKRIIENTRKKRTQFFNYFHSDDFYVDRSTTSKDNVIDIELNHKIRFPKLYSDYAIDRVFHEGNINEDKLMVLYYLMTNIIIKDIKECIYDKYYLIEFATSLFQDKEKQSKILAITSNDCFKNQTIFKISYEEYTKYADNIKDMIREGYKFAINVDEDIEDDDFVLFNIFEYIIVNKHSKYCNNIEENDKILIINDR